MFIFDQSPVKVFDNLLGGGEKLYFSCSHSLNKNITGVSNNGGKLKILIEFSNYACNVLFFQTKCKTTFLSSFVDYSCVLYSVCIPNLYLVNEI